MQKRISDDFHIYYEENRIWEKSSWLGIPMWKLPFDAWILQELIFKHRPDYIIETGTGHGGSSVFYASIMYMVKCGKVITVDKENKLSPMHGITKYLWDTRVEFIEGSSVDPGVVRMISEKVQGHFNFVVLDSWHSYDHVLKELHLYSPLVPVGGYLIVEDTHVNGNPCPWKWGDGPMEAVETFLSETSDFEIDKECEKFIMTFNPNGFLRRKK